MDPDDIINILFEAGVDLEDLDEQVEYIILSIGMKATMKRFGICEHGYYEGRGCDICEEQEWGDMQCHMRKDEGE